MDLLGHVGLALATSLSGLFAAGVLAILLHHNGRLGRNWFGDVGRITLATLVMAVLLLMFINFGVDLKQSVPAVIWLACLVVVGAVIFIGAAAFFKAIPARLFQWWEH